VLDSGLIELEFFLDETSLEGHFVDLVNVSGLYFLDELRFSLVA